MQVTIASDIFQQTDASVLFTFDEGSDAEGRAMRQGANVSLARERKEFEGKPKQLYLEKLAGSPRFILIVGLGKRAELTTDLVRTAAGLAADTLRALGAKQVAIEPPTDEPILAQACTEGALLRTYQYNRYKTKRDDIKELGAIAIMTAHKTAVERGTILAEAVNEARDLANMPGNDCTPQEMALRAAKVAKEEKLKCQILDKSKLQKLGYGGMVAVGKGSLHEPRLVTIEYTPKGATTLIALVGKGITFDTGGVNVKPGEHQSPDMKFDMTGAAVVLGAIRAASRLRLPVKIVGVLCLAENMMDGHAYKPGDVITMKSGKTVEVHNTDAEGRVVLADGIAHAKLYRPDAIVDIATLTGAVVVALGDNAAGVLGTDAVVEKLKEAAAATGEKIWPLPVWEEYAEDIKSSVADIKNVGVRGSAGTIAGAMFLKEFAGDTPWAHLDIAGVAWTQGRERWHTPTGSTGFGVRLLTEYLSRQ
jgi:leucyl aminopeptidase